MSVEQPDITDPTDVARLVFSAEDGVIQGDLTWQSYVDTDDDGTIIVDVYPDHIPMCEGGVPTFRYRVEYVGHAPNPGEGWSTVPQATTCRASPVTSRCW